MLGALTSRRRSTLKPPRATAFELPNQPKSLELEVRLSRLELEVRALRLNQESILRRLTAIQAHLDHLDSKARGLV